VAQPCRCGLAAGWKQPARFQKHFSPAFVERFRYYRTVMHIPEHRKAIDKLDAQIVRLLNERTKHVLAIGEFKLKAGEEIYVPHRERAVLDRICRLNAGPMTNDQLRAVYREVMSSAPDRDILHIRFFPPDRVASRCHQNAIRAGSKHSRLLFRPK
jgi:chorismate mutase-like protein